MKEAERRGEQRLDDCAFLSSPVLPSSWWWCDSPCGYSREDPQLDDCAHVFCRHRATQVHQSYPKHGHWVERSRFFFSSPVSFGNLFFRADYTARFARPGRVGGGAEHCVCNGRRWRRCYSLLPRPTPPLPPREWKERGAECRGVEWTRHGMEQDVKNKTRERPFSLFCTVCTAAID